MIRNIIWDVDGTLFDTYPAIAQSFHQAMLDLGCDVPIDWIMARAKISAGDCAADLAERCHVPVGNIAEKYRQYYAQVPAAGQPPFPGVIKICQYILDQGGKNVIVTHRGLSSMLDLLTAHEMTACFAGWITRDDDYPRKPNPMAFEDIMETHHLLKAETLAVGDREIDIRAGHNAGIIACRFDPEKSETSAELAITEFEALYRYLTENAEG